MTKEKSAGNISPYLTLTALLSSSITIVVSVIYTALCIVAIVYRYQCDNNNESLRAADFLMNALFLVYIQNDDCPGSVSWDGLTQPDTVFILVLFTLIFSILSLVAACALIAVLREENTPNYFNLVGYVYVGVCVASFVIDLTLGVHFGMDYGFLTNEMNLSSPGLGMNYLTDIVRIAAILLMTISLKGFVAHVVNMVLLGIMVYYLVECHKMQRKEQHSIHTMGALNAYDQPRQRQNQWQSQPDMFLGLPRNQNVNPAFSNDDDFSSLPPAPRSPIRDQTMSDYSNRYYDRSESWQHRSASSRPFSYIEEPKRPMPMKQPPVPAPDYSPPARRLKSALKPGYM